MGKVYLVGAGPGDEGLITLKGFEKLKQCDAVVYDRLATEKLLDVVRPNCEKIYVGKEAGKHGKKQEEINKILVECAGTHKLVVRLKGGDPFVFGRAGEEIEALQQYRIPYEVIPGVTSAVAVPECAGIPVTYRGISRSFHVITGHTENSVGNPEYDYETIARMEGTIVFLMGLSNIGTIAGELVQAGKAANTPAAVISEGTTREQRCIRGTLATIGQMVKEYRISSPAVIVIGETAGMEYMYHPEGDKKVGVIATELLWRKLQNGLENLGMHPLPICRIKIIPTEHMEELEQELLHLEEYRWILFTSQNAVLLFFEKMRQKQIDIRALANLKFAVLGSGTEGKLLEYGIKADFKPSEYTIAVLAEEFSQMVMSGERVLIPRAVRGSPELTAVLSENHIAYKDIPIYDVDGMLTKNIECMEKLSYLVFVSASGVTIFFDLLRKADLELPKQIRLVCIGKITQRRLLEEYGEADAVAAVSDVDGLMDAILQREHKGV